MNYRDTHEPLKAHALIFDRVRLEFGDDGVLHNPDADQVAVMTANPIRRARFVEAEDPKPAPTPAPPAAAATSAASKEPAGK